MTDIQIGFGWNAFQTCTSNNCQALSIQETGIKNWSDPNIMISIYFYMATTGLFDLSVIPSSVDKDASLLVNIPDLSQQFNIDFKFGSLNPVTIGKINITNPGYIRVDFKPIKSLLNIKNGNFAGLKTLVLSGLQDISKINYVKNQFSSHFGRRGPSVHMRYNMENKNDIQYFMNEVTVPENFDVIGTYAMTIGFKFGYVGMQVNSNSERRILFSVWSPQQTDDPNQILPENNVILVQKGNNTIVGTFGNEGSGGQSYMIYPWVAGVSYQFKLEGEPSEDGYSTFSAYFNDPTKKDGFILIAQFKRPKTQSYLTELHSFLENFNPETGHISKKVYYNNQQAIDKNGNLIKILSAQFTYDSTADQQMRLDYEGGYNSKLGLFLRNDGFFTSQSKNYDEYQIKKN